MLRFALYQIFDIRQISNHYCLLIITGYVLLLNRSEIPMTQRKHNDPLFIEITSDFVCPWCFIGEARLEKAIRLAAPEVPVQRAWRPYELNPDMPQEGRDRHDYMTQKFGAAKVKAMEARMKELGREDGIEFRQELIKRSPNTRLAHRLNWL